MPRGRMTRPSGATRRRVIARDDNECQRCHRRFADHDLEVDHITELEAGGSNRDENLRTLCRACHARKTRGGGVRLAVLAASLLGAAGALLYGPWAGALPWAVLAFALMARAERRRALRPQPLADDQAAEPEVPAAKWSLPSADRTGGGSLDSLPFAIGADGSTLAWPTRLLPHCLVIGPTGTGKTVCLRTLIENALDGGWKVWALDPKRIELTGYRGRIPVASTLEDMTAAIRGAHDLMMERYDDLENGRLTEDDLSPLLLICDEFATLATMANRHWKENREKGQTGSEHPSLELHRNIARLGRSARVHMVVGTQRPDAEFLSGEARDNFRCRVALGPLSQQGALMVWEDAQVGRDAPKGQPGVGYVDVGDGPVPAKVMWTPAPTRTRQVGAAVVSQ